MKKDGIALDSRGIEEVYLWSEKDRRTVWRDPSDNNFYVRLDGEFVQVYRKGCIFSTEPEGINYRSYCHRHGYSVKVFDRPSRSWVNLCEYNHEDEKWQDCLFDTVEEAIAARDRYEEAWHDYYAS